MIIGFPPPPSKKMDRGWVVWALSIFFWMSGISFNFATLSTVSRPKWIGSTRGVCVYNWYKDTRTLRVLPIHFGRETVPSALQGP